ncbi:MAG: hypothetical protein M1818_007396 [Claussenomyces sp. TS43310]|nr:MAG: hypothetical protein M1818_007396 [Claussenomyces sp. TS43310]
MSDRRYPRPRSPPLLHPARSSLPVINYGASYSGDLHAVPTSRREFTGAAQHNPVVTTYKITPEVPARSSSTRDNSRNRSTTLDNRYRPAIITTAPPRRQVIHTGRPASPVQNPYRSSDEGEYYTIPASSEKRRQGRHRPSYSATLDNSDMHRLGREGGSDRLLRPKSGRESQAIYSQTKSRPVYAGTMVKTPDTGADEYGVDGYNYTNPRDLVQYDLNRTAKHSLQRQDSYEGSRSGRPSSITGYADLVPRSMDTRERGPPPSTRGFDKISSRTPLYDAPPPVRVPAAPAPVEPINRPATIQPIYDDRKSRRPVSVYQESNRHRPRERDEYYDPRDEDLRERRRDKTQRSERHDDVAEKRGSRSERDRNEYDTKNDYDKKEYDRRNDYDRRDEVNDRHGKKGSRDDNHKSGRDTLAAGLSLAGAALGLGALTKNSKDDDRDERDENTRRRDEEPRRRREPREDRDAVETANRDGKDRYMSREDVDTSESRPEMKERLRREDKPETIDLNGRDPQERRPREDRDQREEMSERRERRKHRSASTANITPPDSRSESSVSDEPSGNRVRGDRSQRDATSQSFNPKDTMDLRALKEMLNNQDSPAPVPVLAKEPLREPVREPVRESVREPTREPLREAVQDGVRESVREPVREPAREPAREAIREPVREFNREQAFDPRDARDLSMIQAELRDREERGRRELVPSESEERRSVPRLVSPPREEASKSLTAAQPIKGILRQPKEKFPEDPAPIREGVAPLKDAKKDGVPPNARWTKINRKFVNPEALEAGKERYEARDDFVIVLRVLSKEEVQGYAEVTQRIRAAREEEEDRARRHRRRERHERHKRERSYREHNDEGHDYEPRRRRREREREREKESHSESDTTSEEETTMKLPEPPRPRRITFDDTSVARPDAGNLREDPESRGTYTGYTRNPPPAGRKT